MAMLQANFIVKSKWREIVKVKSIVWERVNSIILLNTWDFGPKKDVSFGGALSSTTYVELVRATQRTIGLLYPGRDKSNVNFYCTGF